MTAFLPNLIAAFKAIGHAFVVDASIWWLLAPILLLWIASEIYYGEYKKERIGFASALSIGISFLWINLVSLRIFFLTKYDSSLTIELALMAVFTLYAIVIIYVSFTHALPERVIDKIASPTPVYFLSVTAFLLGEGTLGIDYFIAGALLALFFAISFVFYIIKRYFLGLRGEVELIKKLGEKNNL